MAHFQNSCSSLDSGGAKRYLAAEWFAQEALLSRQPVRLFPHPPTIQRRSQIVIDKSKNLQNHKSANSLVSTKAGQRWPEDWHSWFCNNPNSNRVRLTLKEAWFNLNFWKAIARCPKVANSQTKRFSTSKQRQNGLRQRHHRDEREFVENERGPRQNVVAIDTPTLCFTMWRKRLNIETSKSY